MSGFSVGGPPINPADDVPEEVLRILAEFHRQEQHLFQRLMALRGAEKTGGEYDGITYSNGRPPSPAASQVELPFYLFFSVGPWTVEAFWQDEGSYFCELECHFHGSVDGQAVPFSITIDLPGPGGRMGWG